MATGTSDASQTDPHSQHGKSRFILRHVKFRNFVKFEEEQELKFEKNGVYFLIGQNQSGKTSVLEAIRRCLSLRYSSSFSSIPNPNEDSIIVTRYENGNDEEMLAFCLYKCKDGKIDVCLKGCALVDRSGNTETRLGLDLVHNRSRLTSRQLKCSNTPVPSSKNLNLNRFREWITEQYEHSKKSKWCSLHNYYHKSECEKLLEEHLDCVVFVFPMRSFGPLQWSKSSKITNQTDNYLEACQRAEIIMWYLDRYDQTTDTTDEQSKEKDLYDFICGNRGGSYVLDKSNSALLGPFNICAHLSRSLLFWLVLLSVCLACVVCWPELSSLCIYEKNSVCLYACMCTFAFGCLLMLFSLQRQRSRKDKIQVRQMNTIYPILKQSEGFIEAKICSILLSVKDFGTVSLEDPGAGMHPQMIDRLCQAMSERVNDRVIIVTTHTAHFLKPWLLDRLFYFNRVTGNDKDKKDKFTIVPGTSLSQNTKLKAAIPGKVTSEQFANFCCGEIIVFVEGPSDHLFIQALARIMRKSSETHFKLLSRCQFVIMNSKYNHTHFKSCCRILHKKCVFVLDRDGNKELKTTKEMFYWDSNDLEDVFWKALERIKASKFTLSQEMCFIINKCFPKIVTFEKNVITHVKDKAKRFKVFLHGNGTFEQREKLIEYLLKNRIAIMGNANDPGGLMDLERIRSFLIDVCEN